MKRKVKRIIPSPLKPARKSLKMSLQNDDGFGTSMPPPLAVVAIYFDQKSMADCVCDFYDEHELRQWKNQTGQPITNWKVCATEWIYNYRQEMKWKLRQSPFYSKSF